MSFKNTGILFCMRSLLAKNGCLQIKQWPVDCPSWLGSVFDDTLSEIDNSETEVQKLLQAFIDNDDYQQLKQSLEGAKWFVDSYGVIRE